MTGWRTIVFNVVSLIVLVFNNMQAAPWIPPQVAEYGLIAANIFLRWLTTTPMGVAPK